MKISANKQKLQQVLNEWNKYHTQWIIINELKGEKYENYTLKATNYCNIICDFEIELIQKLNKIGHTIICANKDEINIDITIKIKKIEKSRVQ